MGSTSTLVEDPAVETTINDIVKDSQDKADATVLEAKTQDLPLAKEHVKQQIEEKAQAEIAKIDANQNLTDAQKAELKSMVNEAKEAALATLDKITDPEADYMAKISTLLGDFDSALEAVNEKMSAYEEENSLAPNGEGDGTSDSVQTGDNVLLLVFGFGIWTFLTLACIFVLRRKSVL